MSNVGSDRCRNTQGFLTKNVKEIFWDLKSHRMSENAGVGSHRFHCTCKCPFLLQVINIPGHIFDVANCIVGVMVSILASSVADRRLKPWSGQRL